MNQNVYNVSIINILIIYIYIYIYIRYTIKIRNKYDETIKQ